MGSPIGQGIASALALAVLPAFAFGDTAVGVTAGNDLVTFETSAPGTIVRRVAITGLAVGENVVGIDFRPKDGRLYALGSTSRLYVIDRTSGAATQIGAGPFSPALAGSEFGFDFSPAADRIRVVSNSLENLRLDPDTGAVTVDTPLAFSALDTNVLANPSVVAVSYDQNVAGGATTTAFAIDSALDVLVRLGGVNGAPDSPNAGNLHTIGSLGINASGATSLDTSGVTTFAAVTAPSATTTNLFTINLATGAATLRGTIGGGDVVRAMAIAPVRFVGITIDDEIVTFSPNAPSIVSTPVAVTGLRPGEHIVAVDTRPSTGQLYALGDSSRLYRLNAATGAATQVGSGTFLHELSGTEFGMDFDPEADRVVVVSDADQNIRINPDTGGVQLDSALAYATGDLNASSNPNVVALAHDPDVPGTVVTTLYGIDSGLDILVRIGSFDGSPTPPTSGELRTNGTLGVDFGARTSFDLVGPSGIGFAVVTATGAATSEVYEVILQTGAVVLKGPVGGGKAIRAATLSSSAPAPAPASIDLVALTDTNALVTFKADNPGVLSSPLPITGLEAGENVIAIDTRPSTGVLYGLSSQSRLYAIGRTSGAATLIGSGPFAPALEGAEFGFDFDPVLDQIRVASDVDRNFRLDPATGTVVDGDGVAVGTQRDTDLAFAGGDVNASADPNVVALAYDRNVAATPATTLFGIDAGLDVLVRQGGIDGTPASASSGQLTTVGPLGVNSTTVAGFEVANGISSGLAALLVAGGGSKLFSVDLATGSAALVGEIGSGQAIRGFSTAPTADLTVTPPPPPPPGTEVLVVKKLSIKINFRASGKDSITLQGTLPAPTGSLAGKSVDVDVGGVTKSFVLDAKGKGVSGDDRFQLVGRARNGVIKFLLMIRKEDVSDTLADNQLTGDVRVVRGARQVRVQVVFDGTTYVSDVQLVYNARALRSGVANKKKGT